MSKGSRGSNKLQIFRVNEEGELSRLFYGEKNSPLNPEGELDDPTSESQQKIIELESVVKELTRGANSQPLTNGQMDSLQNYIKLKEQETSELRKTLKKYQSTLGQFSKENEKLSEKIESLESKIKSPNLEGKSEKRNDANKGSELNLKRIARGLVEQDLEEIEKLKNEWQAKIRDDLKRIKLKEKEFENKQELMRRDTQALLDSKDKHILELKKKWDALQLEKETIEQNLLKQSQVMNTIEAKKKRLVETMKLAISLLERIDRTDFDQS